VDIQTRLKRARRAAGLTQHEVAERTGIPQSSISAYESGARAPSEDACRRILTAAGVRPSTLLARHRAELVDRLGERGVHDIAVFGSVARGVDDEGSDIDLLVTLPAGTSLLDVVEITEQIEHIVGTDVDLISRRSLQPERFALHRTLLDEAVPV
jgi:predicted nucleotidyltransferase